jgi:DNA modification methylase
MQIQVDKVDFVPVNSLVPHPKNMNKHPEDQIERLCRLIEYQGFRNPLVVQLGTNLIVAGHGRLEAAKKLGYEKVPVTYQKFDDEAQLYAYMTSDNAIASWAELDLSQINLDIQDLGPELDIDMLGLKDFAIEPLDRLEPQCDEDEVPEVEHPITRRGDIWLLGNHRVMCGDSTMVDDVEKLMNGEKADMVFTDPPYGMNLKTDYADSWGEQSNTSGNIGFRETKNHKPVIGDDEYFDPSFLIEYFNCKEVFLWGADYYCKNIPDGGGWLVWDKTGGNDSLMNVGFNANFELVWSKQRHKRDLVRHTYKGVAGMKPEDGKRIHPTQKPVGLGEWFIDKYSKTEHLIIDVYLGSGTTLIACEKTNRKCYGMELDEHYCDVIIKRWEQYTGKKATLEGTGQTYAELRAERDS